MGAYDIEARKQRWQAFLSMYQSVHYLYQITYQPDSLPPPLPWPTNRAERIEWAWETYQRHLARTGWLNDDSLPFLDVRTGTEIFAEAFGCQIHRPESDMPAARPLVHTAREAARLKVPSLDAPPLALLFEIADELRRRTGPQALVRQPDLQSPMGVAALIWDKNDLYMALLDAPDAVLELAAKVKALQIAFFDKWFARYGREFIAHYPNYYMPQGLTVSEDEAGAVGEEMFRALYLPELVELSQRYGGLGMHCCATARHQWVNFKKIPDLRLLNFAQPPDVTRAAYHFFGKHVPQMHQWCGDGPAWTWPAQYPDEAWVAVEANATSRDEALELADKLHAACGRTQ